MEVLEKGKSISIHAGGKFPIKNILVDAGIVIILIWGVFAILVYFFSQPGGEILPYFIAITLLLVAPLVFYILIRQSRHYRNILFNGERKVLFLRGIWRSWQVPFEEIRGFQVNKYRFKGDLFLYRFDAVLSSGTTLRLIQDVPDKAALCSLGEKVGDLVKKPLHVCH
ncbi:MAG: hypothetical protein JSW70_07880 [Syntrophobacterales bacterium]|nr:MAG: hypothetical protein JSW70_07880 [Syntrophobacterales bacterium]